MPTITGTPGDDVIVGGPEGDIIDGLAGNDTIIDRGAGVTQIRGGDGNDTIRYLDFENGLLNATITIDAGNGDDAVFFDSLHLDSASSVAINPGAGNDTLHHGTVTREADRPYWYSYSYAAPMTIDLGPGSDTLVLGYYFGRIIAAPYAQFDPGSLGARGAIVTAPVHACATTLIAVVKSLKPPARQPSRAKGKLACAG